MRARLDQADVDSNACAGHEILFQAALNCRHEDWSQRLADCYIEFFSGTGFLLIFAAICLKRGKVVRLWRLLVSTGLTR